MQYANPVDLADGFACVLTALPGQALSEVSGVFVRDRVQHKGALVLRGFAGDLPAFERFTQTVATRFIHNGNDSREAMGDEGKTRSVTPGSNAADFAD